MKRWITPSFLLALALLAACEVIVRLGFQKNMSGRFEYGYHPTAGFVEDPDGQLRLVRAGGRRFQPQSLAIHRPAGVFRILVVGDSVARGPNLESAYPHQLADELERRGIQAETANLSLPGYGEARKQIVLQQALKYEPSLVVLHVNASNEYEDEREYKRSEEFKSWHPKNWLMKSLVIRRLYEMKTEQIFWNWLPQAVRNRGNVSDADAEVAASINPAKLEEWQEHVRKFTTSSTALARKQGVPIILVTQATGTRDPAGKLQLFDQHLDLLAQTLVTNGVYHLSMKRTLEGQAPEIYSDSSHLRASGHALLAKALADLIQQQVMKSR